MIDPDISAAQARALLTVRDDDPSGINRRRFLQMIGWGVGGSALLSGLGVSVLPNLLPHDLREAWAGGPLGSNEGVLVLICFDGGNDGLNTVVPYSKPQYYSYRTNISIAENQLLKLNGDLGLHPNLSYIKTLWDQNEVAIVQGVGYPNPNLSHFDSMATWMYGRAGGGLPSSGWVGRWLDGLGGTVDAFKAATIGSGLPLHLIGENRRGIAIPPWGFDFGGETDAPRMRMYNAVKMFSSSDAGNGPWHQAVALAEKGQIDVAETVAPFFDDTIPDGELVRQLTVAARLINADIGLRVIDTSMGAFDNHADEPNDHGTRMTQFNAGIQAFYTALDPKFRSRVTLMTFSEFGRTPWSNDSLGTDHGTSVPHFVIGGNVKGGLYGAYPSLTKPNGQDLAEWDRLDFSVDFRSLYATMLDGLLGGGASTVLNGNFEKFDLFRAPPADGWGSIPAVTVQFVGIVPARLLDTRDGGGPPVGPAAKITVAVGGKSGVPANAVAAVLNVTAVGATAASYLTVWPTGVAWPTASSLNVAGGDVVPNLVIAKLGTGGSVDIYNNNGSIHCVVDVVGYFVDAAAARFNPLSPDRLLDTREGVGAPAGAVGQGKSIDVQVGGWHGVAADATSVVMNVTVTAPTGSGYITVWPTGTTMPTASNLNFVPGQTVPNLVIAKLGPGGKVSLFNSAGNTHIVADVLGYFSESSGARMQALSPSRLLDTRDGTGAVAGKVGQTPLALPVLNRGGVPAGGVSAVALNVTATEGSSGGYVTVYPNGQPAPLASNLNIIAGQTRANLVIAKVGSGGAVALFNSAGNVHLIADVVGYFTS